VIVYNVKRRWFTMKNDAETYRKSEGLKPDALFTLRVDGRDELAWVLNQICQYEPAETEVPPPPDPDPLPAPPDVIQRAYPPIIAPDFVPAFLLRDPPYAKDRS